MKSAKGKCIYSLRAKIHLFMFIPPLGGVEDGAFSFFTSIVRHTGVRFTLPLLVLAAYPMGGCHRKPVVEVKSRESGPASAGLNTASARRDLERAIAARRDMAQRALNARDYELASTEFQNASALTQLALSRERLTTARGSSRLKERDIRPLEDAIATHNDLAGRFQKEKDFDLALTEYQAVAALYQMGQSREEQNLNARIDAVTRKDRKAREDLEEWYRRKDRGVTGRRHEELLKQYQEKLKDFGEKSQRDSAKSQKKVEALQKEGASRIQNLTQQRIKAFEAMAKIHRLKGEKELAISNENMVHQEQAALYQRQRDWPKAEAEFRAWIKASPKDYSAHYGLAQLMLTMRKPAQAEKEFRWMVEQSPDNTTARLQLAQTLEEQKKWGAVIEQRREILRRTALQMPRLPQGDPRSSEFKRQIDNQLALQYTDLGRALTQANRPAEARQAYDKAKSLSPALGSRAASAPLLPSRRQ